jgi:hypothetical protein
MNRLKNKIEELIDTSKYDEACELVRNEFGFTWNIKNVRFDCMDWDKDGQKRNIFNIELKRGSEVYNFDFGSSIYDSCKIIEYNEWDNLKNNDLIEIFAGLYLQTTKEVFGSVQFKATKEDLEYTQPSMIEKYAEELEKDYNEKVKKNNKKWTNKYNNGTVSRDYANSQKCNSLKNKDAFNCIQKVIRRKIDELKEVKKEHSKNIQKIPIVEPKLYDILTCLTKYNPGTFENFCSEFGYDEDSKSAEKTYNAVKEAYINMCRLFSDEELEILQLIN